ncbi:MAG: purine-nucleoside phosphorylase [Clostridia bacterium]|nr:purine-nucleoside phosphorylase [Clostridia bacterium]
MEDIHLKASETAAYIKQKIRTIPEIAVVLGSGLGPLVDRMDHTLEICYQEIPNFPVTTVEGHAGKLIIGHLGEKQILAMQGRFHYYEGYDSEQVTFAVRVFKLLGINNLLVTNAAGGINESFKPGDLMLIKDHISFFAPSPLRGRNISEFGVRFPDMSEAYNKSLIEAARKAAERLNIDVQEGIYAFAQGPMFETPAEIRALGFLGADAVGMSTVPEVIVAQHCGMKALGISCITNMAAGVLGQPLNHEEIMVIAKAVEDKFASLVKEIVKDWTLK